MMMGHSKLIGWYNPGSKRFCYKDEKEVRPDSFKKYTQPVYAVVEEGMRKDLEAENKMLKTAIREGMRQVIDLSCGRPAYSTLKQALEKAAS